MSNGSGKNDSNAYMVLWYAWDSFWQRTSISGVSNAGAASSVLRRTCWIIIFTLFSVLTCLGLWNVIYDYSLYPVTTSVTVKHQNQVEYSVLLYVPDCYLILHKILTIQSFIKLLKNLNFRLTFLL